MKKFGIGIQLYGVRHAMAEDFEGTLEKIRDMGYEYVEFAGYFGKSSEEIKAILDRLGLKCVSVHQGLEFFDEDPDGKAEFLKGFGVKYSVIPGYPKDHLKGSANWDKTIEKFKSISSILGRHGIMLGYHNHEYEFETFEGKYLHASIFDEVGLDNVFPQLDTCWVHYAGIRPEEKIREFKGHVPIVHLKDFVCKNFGAGPVYQLIDSNGNVPDKKRSRADNGFEYRALGRGIQDILPSVHPTATVRKRFWNMLTKRMICMFFAAMSLSEECYSAQIPRTA